MSLNRYKQIQTFLHFNNNDERDHEENKNNKIYKISPVLDRLTLDKEQDLSIEEQIIPAKMKKSGIRQYNPTKWGFMMFGLMFLRSCVLELCKTTPKHENYKAFFDNWFCNLSISLELESMGILTTSTARKNRLGKYPLKSIAELMRVEDLLTTKKNFLMIRLKKVTHPKIHLTMYIVNCIVI